MRGVFGRHTYEKCSRAVDKKGISAVILNIRMYLRHGRQWQNPGNIGMPDCLRQPKTTSRNFVPACCLKDILSLERVAQTAIKFIGFNISSQIQETVADIKSKSFRDIIRQTGAAAP